MNRKECDEVNQAVIEALHIDLAEIEAAFGGHIEIYCRYLMRFPKDKTFFELQEAVSEGSGSEIARAAHSLKGLCATLRLTKLAGMAKEIEARAEFGKIEEIEDRMPELLKEYNEIVLCIEQYT